ncbi:hypothetical protein ACA910_010950 [Epithemia clementina (nom. ined.)]
MQNDDDHHHHHHNNTEVVVIGEATTTSQGSTVHDATNVHSVNHDDVDDDEHHDEDDDDHDDDHDDEHHEVEEEEQGDDGGGGALTTSTTSLTSTSTSSTTTSSSSQKPRRIRLVGAAAKKKLGQGLTKVKTSVGHVTKGVAQLPAKTKQTFQNHHRKEPHATSPSQHLQGPHEDPTEAKPPHPNATTTTTAATIPTTTTTTTSKKPSPVRAVAAAVRRHHAPKAAARAAAVAPTTSTSPSSQPLSSPEASAAAAATTTTKNNTSAPTATSRDHGTTTTPATTTKSKAKKVNFVSSPFDDDDAAAAGATTTDSSTTTTILSRVLFHVWWICLALGLLPSLWVYIPEYYWPFAPQPSSPIVDPSAACPNPVDPDNTTSFCAALGAPPSLPLPQPWQLWSIRSFSVLSILGPTHYANNDVDDDQPQFVLALIWWLLMAYLSGHVLSIPRLLEFATKGMLPLMGGGTKTTRNKPSKDGGRVSAVVRIFSVPLNQEQVGPKFKTSVQQQQSRDLPKQEEEEEAPPTPTPQRKRIRWIHNKTKVAFRTTLGVPTRLGKRIRKTKNKRGEQHHDEKGREPPSIMEEYDELVDSVHSHNDDQQTQQQQSDTIFSPLSWYTQLKKGQPLHGGGRRRSEQPEDDFDDDDDEEEDHNNSEHTGLTAPLWLQRVDPTRLSKFTTSPIMQQLLRHDKLKRRDETPTASSSPHLLPGGTKEQPPASLTPSAEAAAAPCPKEEEKEDEPTSSASTTSIGQFGVNSPISNFSNGDKQFEYTIHPVLKIRGMDIFLSDGACFDVSQEPWFHINGLRDVPTFIANCVTQWGNILVYFELPAWVTNFQDALIEQEHDGGDVRALKRFLSGSDDYRNQRLKMIPSIVDGPLAVKVLAPPKKERVIHGSVVPISWFMHDTEVSPTTGKTMQPVVVVAMDCVSGRAIRSMAGIIKKYMVKLTLDLALVITSPDSDAKNKNKLEDDEPHACLGLFRFEHIDVEACPEFPVVEQEEEEEEKQDLALACSLTGVSVEELAKMNQ